MVAEYSPNGSGEIVFRPAGGAFGARQTRFLPPGEGGRSVVGIDALGGTVHLNLVGGPGTGPTDRVVALVRAGAGPVTVVPVSTANETESAPDLDFDPFGNGLAVWSSPDAGGGAIRAAAYSAGPPMVRDLRVGRKQFRFRASEPAAVHVTVRRGRGRRTTQAFLARPGVNRIAIRSRVRRAMRRKGRYSVLVLTADAGPRIGTLRVRVRRR